MRKLQIFKVAQNPKNALKNIVYTWQKTTRSQVSSNIKEPIDFFNESFLQNEIVTEINNYAEKKLEGKKLSLIQRT
ncbi:piggyBac transposable element-derived protein 4-like [Vespula squamosa]|uniref:PiggyBac transposable element-derived protein 4-like n=1 Tax=Vespula squamosa TaxID=30214 RepID=A0ABD2BXV7_VESSQ